MFVLISSKRLIRIFVARGRASYLFILALAKTIWSLKLENTALIDTVRIVAL